MTYHPKDTPLLKAAVTAECAAAEAKYCLTAFELAAAPIGSRDWTLYWAGWLASSKFARHTRNAQPTEAQVAGMDSTMQPLETK